MLHILRKIGKNPQKYGQELGTLNLNLKNYLDSGLIVAGVFIDLE